MPVGLPRRLAGVRRRGVVETDDGVDRCTLHPRDASAAELRDTWITAAEGAFVSVTRIR